MRGCVRWRKVGRRRCNGPRPLLECRGSRPGRPFREEAMCGRVEPSGGSRLGWNEESGVPTSKRQLVAERGKSRGRRSLDRSARPDRNGNRHGWILRGQPSPGMSLRGSPRLDRNDRGRRADEAVLSPNGHPDRKGGSARSLRAVQEERGPERMLRPSLFSSSRPGVLLGSASEEVFHPLQHLGDPPRVDFEDLRPRGGTDVVLVRGA